MCVLLFTWQWKPIPHLSPGPFVGVKQYLEIVCVKAACFTWQWKPIPYLSPGPASNPDAPSRSSSEVSPSSSSPASYPPEMSQSPRPRTEEPE